MTPNSLRRRATWLSVAIVGALSLAGTAAAQTALKPNLIPLGAFGTTLATDSGGRSTLRFSTTSWNNGAGPLELAAGEVETGSGKLRVYQVAVPEQWPSDPVTSRAPSNTTPRTTTCISTTTRSTRCSRSMHLAGRSAPAPRPRSA